MSNRKPKALLTTKELSDAGVTRIVMPATVDHPPHYQDASGIECIDVAENMSFNLGNALKYIWRAGKKGDAVEDLQKARWYIEREIRRLRNDKP